MKDKKWCAVFRTSAVIVVASALFLGCCSVLLAGCGSKSEDTNIFSVTVNNLDVYYLPDSIIDIDEVTVTVTYNDFTTEELTKKVYDDENVSDDTQFVLKTDGLYSEICKGNDLAEGDYNISCVLTSTGEKFDLMTLTVGSNYENDLSAVLYEDPEFVSVYKDNLSERTGEPEDTGIFGGNDVGSTEDNFFLTPDGYYVGDDNEFMFKPRLIVANKSTGEIGTFSGFNENAVVKLSSENENSGNLLDNDPNPYVSYNEFGFDFTEEAIGSTFDIEMTTSDFGLENSPSTLTVTVGDGYNVTNAMDLGVINLVSNEFNKADYVTGSDEKSYENGTSLKYFWDGEKGELVSKDIVGIWTSFLEENGYATDPVNGIFVHGDITITESDLPEDFFIYEDEAVRFGVNYEEMVGSLRDQVVLYEHNMENDFVINGNLFTIDASSLKWCMTNFEITDRYELTYYPENYSGTYNARHNYLFSFQGLTEKNTPAANRHTATISNVNLIGNANDINDVNGKATGGLSAVRSRTSITKTTNCLVKNFLYGFETDYSDDTFVNVDIDHVKIYDCYYTALYAYYSARNNVSCCEMKRIGGPAMRGMSNTEQDAAAGGGNGYYQSGITADEETYIDNPIAGDEAWFVTNNATEVASYVVLIDLFVKEYLNKTVLDEDGKMNFIYLALSDGYFAAEQPRINTNFICGDSDTDVPFVLNESDAIEQNGGKIPDGLVSGTGEYNAAVTNYFVDGIPVGSFLPMPIVFSTNTGILFSPDNFASGFFDPVKLVHNDYSKTIETLDRSGNVVSSVEMEGISLGNDDVQLYLYYRTGTAGMGVVVTLYDAV